MQKCPAFPSLTIPGKGSVLWTEIRILTFKLSKFEFQKWFFFSQVLKSGRLNMQDTSFKIVTNLHFVVYLIYYLSFEKSVTLSKHLMRSRSSRPRSLNLVWNTLLSWNKMWTSYLTSEKHNTIIGKMKTLHCISSNGK